MSLRNVAGLGLAVQGSIPLFGPFASARCPLRCLTRPLHLEDVSKEVWALMRQEGRLSCSGST